jgi:hypothetical protein
VNHLRSKEKTKAQSFLPQTFGNNSFLLSSLRKTHNGKSILLLAKAIYNGTVPDGEEAHFFQYSIINVNNDCKTTTIDFDEKCIVENGVTFPNFPNFLDEDTTIGDCCKPPRYVPYKGTYVPYDGLLACLTKVRR